MRLADSDPYCSGEFWFFERSDSKLFSRRFAAVQVSRYVSCSLVSTLQEFRFRYPVDVIRVKSYVDGFLYSSLRESRSINFNSLQGGRWPVLLAYSETAEVWVLVKRISLSFSFSLSCMGLPVSPM